MLAIGRYHLDWGSADQPPVAPALAALTDAVLPGSHLALSLPAALATGCAVLLAGLIARELDVVLHIGRDPAPLRPYFDTSREVADVADDMHASLLTGQRQSWDLIWPRERSLTVS